MSTCRQPLMCFCGCRKVRDSLRNVVAPDSIERALSGFQESLWSGGVRRPPSTPRTAEEMSETKLRASKKLALLIPGESGLLSLSERESS
jgi:hypothetical protein